MMEDIFWPSVSFAEKALRPAIVYIFLLIAFRVTGKRELGQFTPFDLTVLLIISNIVQNAMIGNDNSILGGIVGAGTVIVMNRMFNWLIVYRPRWRSILEGRPTVLIEDGVIDKHVVRDELITFSDIYAALRKHDVADIAHVKLATLEVDGTISVVTRRDGQDEAQAQRGPAAKSTRTRGRIRPNP